MDRTLKKFGFVEKYFHTGEVILNYVEGPKNGPALVFIPGQSATWEEYTFIMPLLSSRFHVFAVTLRGHGKSSWTPGQYTFNRLGKDMTKFLSHAVGEPAIVAGNSSGGVLTVWLAANSPDVVRAIVLEDPPLFRCDWPNILTTSVYDVWLAFSRLAVAGGGGYPRFFMDQIVNRSNEAKGVVRSRKFPKLLAKYIVWRIARQQAFSPDKPVDIKLLPKKTRIMMRSTSQFDGNFARAFADGSAGEGFDHAETLSRIAQPILFLHANYFMHQGRLMGALDGDDVARVQSLIRGPWKYIRMNCAHAIALDAPEAEAKEILAWANDYLK